METLTCTFGTPWLDHFDPPIGTGRGCEACTRIARRHMKHCQEIIDRFWSHVQKADGDACWTWTGKPNKQGYGRFVVRSGEIVLAHRFAFELIHGPLGEGRCALHRCDNPPCVRPDHLFEGDRGDNARDMAAKGRQYLQRHPEKSPTLGKDRPPEHNVRGVDHPEAKLADSDVIAVRERVAAGESRSAVARAFGVALSTVGFITTGRTWSHIGGPRTPASSRGRRSRQCPR